MVREPDYGAPCRSVPREAGEIKYIRVTDFDDFGIPEGHQFVTAETVEKRFILEDGDMLFARSGATAGKTFLYRKVLGPALFAGYCIRFRFDTRRILPEFVYLYSKTDRYSAWVRSIQRPSGQPNINKEEFKSFTIPVPNIAQQSRLVAALDAARATRREKLAQADALLAGLDAFVLDVLGLTLPPPDGYSSTYAVRARDARAAKKLYPDYFHPERTNAIRAVQSRYTDHRATTLSGIADFARDQRIVDPGDNYLGLANVQPNTGERIESTEEDGEGNCFGYAEGDVLFARLRPYLNKVYRAESGGVCSTEFHVIRVRRDEKGRPRLIPDYLAAVMRSSLVLAQTRHMMTGNTHPRLANEDVVNLVVPVPDANVQEKIAAEVAHRREEARRLRDEARTIWDYAKRRFEEELLGSEIGPGAPKRVGTKRGRKK